MSAEKCRGGKLQTEDFDAVIGGARVKFLTQVRSYECQEEPPPSGRLFRFGGRATAVEEGQRSFEVRNGGGLSKIGLGIAAAGGSGGELGAFDKAGKLCRLVLKSHPKQTDALHLLAILDWKPTPSPRPTDASALFSRSSPTRSRPCSTTALRCANLVAPKMRLPSAIVPWL
jgi:hypothetical protein